jgi:hypothetical protein
MRSYSAEDVGLTEFEIHLRVEGEAEWRYESFTLEGLWITDSDELDKLEFGANWNGIISSIQIQIPSEEVVLSDYLR